MQMQLCKVGKLAFSLPADTGRGNNGAQKRTQKQV